MNYETFFPSPDLSSLIKCFWTLSIQDSSEYPKQRIVPDGCMELAFNFGDPIQRFTNDKDFVIQPWACLVGQITEPFYIKPTGSVNTFAVRFYPYGIANFFEKPMEYYANRETSLDQLFGLEAAKELEEKIRKAWDTATRIRIIEGFFRTKLKEQIIFDRILKNTIDSILHSKGNESIGSILDDEGSSRRQLERKFKKQIGLSPKKLGKIIRMQAALKMLINRRSEKLTDIAYESNYYDQAHFIKDFKEFTGLSPKEFPHDDEMLLSRLFYKKD
ncbi:AraC family transcriptional regulator [Leptospira bourretii]|uniref:AraC family transcriptional regulator n=1 Tax=Leptospira bourretii TaxID=2484962 RepID=A0A4R9IL53_9LEPT|nr:helix-turn-helix domain-containing protein [Leptospira bourretii]TGK84933.1 AraC family transcriptional regulator [Leptospira bourretii]TGK90700.1 AraC family transcriptional regulator [Leptospira bourretii]TGL35910.1 AraC family transcriptional regulator [Leptospira bourretii]